MPLGSVVGAVATVGGGLIASHSANKAASKAADTSLAVAQQNNALARDIYGQNKGVLTPFVNNGLAAGNQINALLGLGATRGTPAPQPQPQAAPQVARSAMTALPGWSGYRSPPDTRPVDTGTPTPAPTPAVPRQTAGQAAQHAFDIFRNSDGYQFRLGEGQRAINASAAGGGWLQSGAALKALSDYNQQAASGEFGNYMGYLSNQQGVGLGAGSALAGVGNNYVSNVTANNNSAGTAAANAILAHGANNPFANALGQAGGYLMQRYM